VEFAYASAAFVPTDSADSSMVGIFGASIGSARRFRSFWKIRSSVDATERGAVVDYRLMAVLEALRLLSQEVRRSIANRGTTCHSTMPHDKKRCGVIGLDCAFVFQCVTEFRGIWNVRCCWIRFFSGVDVVMVFVFWQEKGWRFPEGTEPP